MPNANLLVTLTIALPAVSVTHLELFLRELSEMGIKWDAKMDSHPSDEDLAALPESIREQL